MRPALVVAAVAAGVVAVAVWGHGVVAADPRIHVNAPPFVGTWQRPSFSWRLAPAAGLAAAVIAFGPVAARQFRWSLLTAATAMSALAWTVALAASDGWSAVAAPLATRYEYLVAVDRVGRPAAFLASFVERLDSYPTHVKGHPPGMVLVLWFLDRIGLGGAGFAAALVLTLAALGLAAVLVAVRDLAGEKAARSVAPFLALSPAAVWVATTADAFFAGVGAAAVALAVLATSPRGSGRRRLAMAVGSGALFGALALLSYGLVLLGTVAITVAVVRHRPLAIATVIAVAGAMLAVFALTGFWWPAGLAATRDLQLAGVASRRPFVFFAVANLAALAVAVGPAALAGAAEIRRRHPALPLVLGAAAALVVADLSGFSKGEVERIWLPFVPWLAVAAVAVRSPRPWLAANAVTGLGLQVMLRSPW